MQKLADMPLFYIKRKTKTEYIYTYSFKTLPTPPYLYHSMFWMNPIYYAKDIKQTNRPNQAMM